jgi:CHAD domain-containing protein
LDPGYCAFGAAQIRERILQLAAEKDGVRKAEDIECVHRMRVASRRIRTALPLFAFCIPKKRYRIWLRNIRAVTRALGEARDTDVQIAFLREYRTALQSRNGARVPAPAFTVFSDLSARAAAPMSASPDTGNQREPAGHGVVCALKGFCARIRTVVTGERKKNPENTEEHALVPFTPRPEQGVDCLILRFQQRRELLQKKVTRALNRLEKDKVLPGMQDYFRKLEMKGWILGAYPRSPFGYSEASRHIHKRIGELFAFAYSVFRPELVAEHHAMRIAAKRLRYTMEVYGDLYDDGLREYIRAMKQLQDLLGRIHDCDVWIATIPGFLEEERGRALHYFGHGAFIQLIEPGIRELLNDRKQEREKLFGEFGLCWEEHLKKGLWENLRRSLIPPADTTVHPDREEAGGAPPSGGKTPDTDSILDRVLALQARYPFGGDHSRQVTALSLRLFDTLQPLHQLGESDRLLLQCAAILHDIGWAFGQKGHHKRSAKMILAETTIPLDRREIQIIAQIARGHRGNMPGNDDPDMAVLGDEDRMKVRKLAALLRIADGLDVTRQSLVSIDRCEQTPVLVTCTISARENPGPEIAAAQKKTDLFRSEFGRDLTISWGEA